MILIVLQSLAYALGGSYAEKKYLATRYPALYEKSDTTGMTYAFDLCIVSLVMYHFWLFNYGMSIGSLRNKYKEKARKDGEKDVDARYSYPNLYVAGGTKHANAFNCAQRSHQQQLETVAAFTLFALTAALSFPVVATVASIIYTISRRIWAKGYGSNNDAGDAQRRYSAFFSGFFWKALATLGFMSFMVCVNLTGLFTFW